MTNKLRGFTTFELGSKKLYIDARIKNIKYVEECTGKGILKLIDEAVNPSFMKVGSIVDLLFYLQDTSKDTLTLDEIEDIIQYDIGIHNVGPVIAMISMDIIPLIFGKTKEQLVEDIEKVTKNTDNKKK